MKNLKKISRNDLGKITGGKLSPDCSYKCCWDSQPNNCSSTVTVSTADSGSVSCSSGSHLVAVN
jgi:hypothetical protein